MIDWQRCTLNIRTRVSLARAAKQVGMDASSIQRLARADIKEPRFSQGMALLDLHHDLMGKDETARLRT